MTCQLQIDAKKNSACFDEHGIKKALNFTEVVSEIFKYTFLWRMKISFASMLRLILVQFLCDTLLAGSVRNFV
jgi:hypothetical protein